MNEIIYKNEKYVLRKQYSDYNESPRDDNNLSIMLFKHNDYNLPWENNDISKYAQTIGELKQLAINEGAIEDTIFIVEAYIHNGIKLNAYKNLNKNCCWDTSIIGIMYTTKDKIKEVGTPIHKINDVMLEELSMFNQYLEGEIYTYSLYENKKYKKIYKDGTIKEGYEEVLIGSISNMYEDLEYYNELIRGFVMDYFGINLVGDDNNE